MSTPAGWYPDPQHPTSQRYWDGATWTAHTAPAAARQPGGYAAQQPQYASAAAYPSARAAGHRKFGFRESVRRGFSRWRNYSDRATPGEYWWFYLLTLIITGIGYLVVMATVVAMFATGDKVPATRVVGGETVQTTELHPTSTGTAAVVIAVVIFVVVALILFFPALALAIRRLHDTDKTGWWYLISFVPFGGIVLLVFFLMPGTVGPNRWGPPVTE